MNNNYLYFDYIVLVMYVILILSIYKNKIWKNIAYNHKVVDYGINGPI